MVFGIPFIRLQLRCKKVPQRIASAPTFAAADMARREQWSPSRLGDYQIARLPPAAASVGAARWAAETIKFWTSAQGRGSAPPSRLCASGGPISSSSGRNGGKNAAKNQWFLEFLSSDCSCGAKRFRNESPLRLPSLPLTGHAESNGRPPVWAIIKSRACRQRRQVWVRPAGPRSEARNIPFENKSAGRCGRRVRAQRLPVRKKERPPKRSFFFGSELSSN